MSEGGQFYSGGEIYTVDDACPTAEAVAVREGIIIAVGSEDTCRSALGTGYEHIDLEGRALLPGFIDTHLHPVVLTYFDMNVDMRGVDSIKGLQEKLRDAASSAPPDAWIVGLQFDEQELREPQLPTRHDLDAACPDRPAIIIKHDAHMVIANTMAIEACGVSASTGDPDGGVIDRESDGTPAGPFRETAAQIILSAMPLPEIDTLIEGAKAAFAKLTSKGITSIGAVLQTDEEGPAGGSGAFDVMMMGMLLEYIPVNLYGLLIARDMEKINEARQTALHQPETGGHRIGALKIFSDGTFGSCSALMNEPYTDEPDKIGFLTQPEEEIYRRMVFAHEAGLQIAIHAIGDGANRKCIDLYERLLSEHPREDHRHRLEHASVLDAGMIADIVRLGLVVATQPLFIHSEKHWLHKRLGPERAKWTYPFRSMIEAGIRVAGASDAPVESTDVLHAIQCCVTREGFEPQQGISAAAAVRMFTLDAAYAQFEESIKGSISVGTRADMVILSENPISVPPERIRDICVERTIIGGDTVYKA
jgi:predicted amidohydrolase YtcJ